MREKLRLVERLLSFTFLAFIAHVFGALWLNIDDFQEYIFWFLVVLLACLFSFLIVNLKKISWWDGLIFSGFILIFISSFHQNIDFLNLKPVWLSRNLLYGFCLWMTHSKVNDILKNQFAGIPKVDNYEFGKGEFFEQLVVDDGDILKRKIFIIRSIRWALIGFVVLGLIFRTMLYPIGEILIWIGIVGLLIMTLTWYFVKSR